MAEQRPHFHLHHRLHLSLALNSPPPPFVFFFAIPSLLSHRFTHCPCVVSFKFLTAAVDAWCWLFGPATEAALHAKFPDWLPWSWGRTKTTIHALRSVSLTLFSFSLFLSFFVCLILSSLVYRTSWFRIYDSGLYGSVERNMLLYALDSLAFSSLCTPECQMKYQTPPWLITRFFLFLLFFSFYFSSFFILFLSQIESLSRRVFGQWQHPKRRKDLRRDKKVQNKKNKKK